MPCCSMRVCRVLTDTGRVDESKKDAIYVHYLFNRVARGARDFTYNGALLIQKRIEQRTLTGIRRTDNSDAHAVLHRIAEAEGINQLTR